MNACLVLESTFSRGMLSTCFLNPMLLLTTRKGYSAVTVPFPLRIR